MHEVYFSIGTNIGDREANMHRAIKLIDEKIGAVTRQSSFHNTEPWGFQSSNRFINAAVCCITDKSPHEVLRISQEIERMLGRKTKSVNGEYHDRLIDIDILLYDDVVIDTPDLKIPHPFMKERDFVMRPLGEILIL